MSEIITIKPGQLTLNEIRRIYSGAKIALDETARPAVEQSAQTVADIISAGKTVYGINTGFGRLAKTTIPNDKLVDLQKNLVMSHATGTGMLLDDDIVRVIMALKVNALARGHSGIRWMVLENIVKLANEGIYPCIPAKGSVGASGDLAPLAHLSCALLGIGNVRVGGKIIPAQEGPGHGRAGGAGTGTQEGSGAVERDPDQHRAGTGRPVSGRECLFLGPDRGCPDRDAAKGSDAPFDPRIQQVRGHKGQADVAASFIRFLEDSEIRSSHLNCDRVQDPYSLRCQPQVMGACLDHLRFTAQTFGIEANAVSDNPLVFSENGDVISGGNFHAEPVCNLLGRAGDRAFRGRVHFRTPHRAHDDPAQSGLPAFLVEDGGVNSGFMIAQVTAAALASENKTLAHPASIDSLPTSANQEDMSPWRPLPPGVWPTSMRMSPV